jgi:MoaA/NifB/PqqE/SkfB family radical SAM enzyme
MSDDNLIAIGKNDFSKSNKLKKEIGERWENPNSIHMELKNFNFGKKILYHPESIVKFKEGKRPFPVTLEIDLTNRCNHRCSFCFYAEHISVNKDSIETKILKIRLKEAKELGTKGISFTGGGEPMIHKDYEEVLVYTKNLGFDVGTITNGSIITEKNVDSLIKNLQWIRISMAGGDAESYAKVQGVDQFEKVVNNIKLLSKRKKELNSSINIGIRTLVTSENIHTIIDFAHVIKKLNVDYFQLAPDQYTNDCGKFWNDESTQNVFKQTKEVLREKGISLLTTAYMKEQEKLDYPTTCYAHFFKAAILAEGHYVFCQNGRDEEKYHIGNIYDQSLKEIWESEKIKEIEEWVKPNNCGLFCKHMAINNSLEDNIHPNEGMSPNFVG